MSVTGYGIMGGTFDPVHSGHLAAAQSVLKKLNLDKIIFIPSGTPPHKTDRTITPAEHRVEMVRLAISEYEYFSLSMIEVNRKGYTYTVDTLRELKKTYGDGTDLFFIIGADVVPELKTWFSYKGVLSLCKFVAVTRPGYNRQAFYQGISEMQSEGAVIIPVEVPGVDVSSSCVREQVAEGGDLQGMLPEKVIHYIYREGLYK